MIDEELRERMILEVQRVELRICHLGVTELVENFSEMGKAWKYDNSIEKAAKVNRMLRG